MLNNFILHQFIRWSILSLYTTSTLMHLVWVKANENMDSWILAVVFV